MAVLTDIADAVAEELNAGSFSHEFTAVRLYLPRYKPADIKDLTVTVVMGPHGVEGATRGASQHDYTVMVGIQKKLDAETNAVIDPMMTLTEEILEFLARRQLASVPHVPCLLAEMSEPFIPEHMDELRVFTAFIAVTYRAMRG